MIETQTHTPVPYEALTEAQRDEISNGCGGKGGKVVPPPYAAMNEANCDHHDYGYWKGGTWLDRLKCDLKLCVAMLKDAAAFGWKKPTKVAYFAGWSILYFAGVRVGGWKYFHYAEVKRYPKIEK